MATITTQADLIRSFKQENPGLDYRPIKSHDGKSAMYKTDTRCAFVDYVDYLHRSGVIGDKLANRATFEPIAKRERKQNKYIYLFVVQGFYGYGWEDLTASESRAEARDNLKDYRNNEPGPHRLIKRRELNSQTA